jgi:hypothetical protein
MPHSLQTMDRYRPILAVFVALTLVFASLAGYEHLTGGSGSTSTRFVTTASTEIATSVSTQEVVKTVTLVETSSEFSVQCGDFQRVPIGAFVEENMTTVTVPVLLIPNLSSTVCVRLMYVETASNSRLGGFGGLVQNGVLDNGLVVWTMNFTRSPNGGMSVQPLKGYAGSFSIFVVPQKENLSEIEVNSTFAVDYFIIPHGNATGFYDESFPRLAGCLFYPLAVGYPAEKVTASNFSGSEGLGNTCPASPFKLQSVQISTGMGYVNVAFPNWLGLE